MIREAQVHNSQPFGTRYINCVEPGKTLLKVYLDKGKQHINEWLKEHKKK
jgi:hypothetical protein